MSALHQAGPVLRVGLTGGIGAGKSTVARRLAERGASVIDADALAREVVEPGTPGLAAVVAGFGDGVLLPDGSLDRAALGRLVFGDDARRAALNLILHPLIAARTAELVADLRPDAILVHDVPLLVENDLGPGYAVVVVVAAPQEERVRRLVEDRGMPAADARSRVRAQATDEQRRAAADVVLDNSGDPAVVLGEVDRVWDTRLLPMHLAMRTRRPADRPATVTLAQPDPAWPGQADRLARRIARAVGGAAVRVDHVGSTSVPGLPAKDVVDLQLVVRDLAAADAVADPLLQAGLPRFPGRWWDDDVRGGSPLPKRLHGGADPGRAVNLHVRPVDGPAWRWQLDFRDWLRAHPDERDAYAEAKRAAAGTGTQEYLAGKGPWIVEAVGRADAWAREGRG